MEANDMAACREALARLRQRFDNDVMAYQDRYLKFSGWHWHKKAAEAAKWRDVFHELREVCDAALAKPPRNCDFGTAGEQAERFKHEMCDNLPSCKPWDECCLRCFAKWSQMPYAAERKGDGDGR